MHVPSILANRCRKQLSRRHGSFSPPLRLYWHLRSHTATSTNRTLLCMAGRRLAAACLAFYQQAVSQYFPTFLKVVDRDTCAVGMLGHCRFADFLREPGEDESGELLPAQKVYEPVPNLQLVRTRAMEYLQRYNEENPAKAANLVLFDDALAHLMIISRIIQVREVSGRTCIFLQGLYTANERA